MFVALAACSPPEHTQPRAEINAPKEPATRTGSKGLDVTMMTCEEARHAIVMRRFVGWRGLPSGCSPTVLFGAALDDSWGALPLGASREPARSRLLELAGYYRPLAYVRDDVPLAFDAMSPQLENDWQALAQDLGEPDATLDWVFGTVVMPGGERIYARHGITVFLNPETEAVVYVTLYGSTTVDTYLKMLRPPREKRSHGR
jgi:hypothetical protein